MTKAIIDTDKGVIEIELFVKGAPKAANNFVELARKGYFDGVIFHRIVPGFVIQGGDGQYGHIDRLEIGALGTGGPGYKFADEPFEGDYARGTVAMANAGPNTNGSQFFICLDDLSGGKLPKKYTLFGQVTAGLEVVDAIAASKRDGRDRPLEPTAMRTVKIED
ncbi:MAG TPA: peptidylprolyl isomerase [Candidatus Limnocylindrales bacterium]